MTQTTSLILVSLDHWNRMVVPFFIVNDVIKNGDQVSGVISYQGALQAHFSISYHVWILILKYVGKIYTPSLISYRPGLAAITENCKVQSIFQF